MSTSSQHGLWRCTLTTNFLFDVKLCCVKKKPRKYFFRKTLIQEIWGVTYFKLQSHLVCLVFFVCLFVCLFVVPLENFSLIWRHQHYQWRAKKITYARSTWPLSSEVSLACNTYCDTGHPFIMVISEDPWHLHRMFSVWPWSCLYLFLRLKSVAVLTQVRCMLT